MIEKSAYEIKMNDHTVGAALVNIENDDDIDSKINNLCNAFGFSSIDDYYICLTRGDGVYDDLEYEYDWLDVEIAYKSYCKQPLVIRFQIQVFTGQEDDLYDWNDMCSDSGYDCDVPPAFYISMAVKDAVKYFKNCTQPDHIIKNEELWFCKDWAEQ